MRFENLLSLIDGELKNSPKVFQFHSIATNSTRVKRGDLFIASEPFAIEEAIKNGAYAILYDKPVQMIDSEIAWIKVASLSKSILKLLRFFLIKEQLPLVTMDKLSFELAELIFEDDSILFLKNPSEALELLSKTKSFKLAIGEKYIWQKLALDFQETQKTKIEVIHRYLFESSFIFEGIYYERVKISPLFLDNLQKVLFLAQEYLLHFNFSHINEFHHFQPHFINGHFEEVEFGKSAKVIVTEKECSLLKSEQRFLQYIAPWAKMFFVTNSACPVKEFKQIETIDQLKAILYNSDFNFLLLKDELFNLDALKNRRTQKKLF